MPPLVQPVAVGSGAAVCGSPLPTLVGVLHLALYFAVSDLPETCCMTVALSGEDEALAEPSHHHLLCSLPWVLWV